MIEEKEVVILKCYKEEYDKNNWVEVEDFPLEIEKNGYKYDKELEQSFIEQMKIQGEIHLMWSCFKLKEV